MHNRGGRYRPCARIIDRILRNVSLAWGYRSWGRFMHVKLIAAVLVIAATVSTALAQGASTEKLKADAQKAVQIISSDSAKTELTSDHASDTWVQGYGLHNKDCLEW